MMIMTYEQILKVTEYQGVAINDKIRQKAIDMTEQLDLLSYHEGLEIVLDDMELLVNEQAEEMTKQAKKVQKEMTKAQSDKKPKKVDSLAKVKTQKAKKKVKKAEKPAKQPLKKKLCEEIQEIYDWWEQQINNSDDLYFGKMSANPYITGDYLLKPFNTNKNSYAKDTLTSMRNVDSPVRGDVLIWGDDNE